MRTKFSFFSIMLALFGLIFNATAQWTTQQQGYHLNSVYFTDSITGYAVGESGTILKTIDAGTNWTTQTSGTTTHLWSVFFTDSNTGYAVGFWGTILKISNSGTTFMGDHSILKQFNIYPNPTNGKFNFDMDKQNVKIYIYNILGTEVLQQTNIISEIDLSNSTKGIYFLKVTDGANVYNQKIIIQ